MAAEETAKDEEGGPRKRRREASDEVTNFIIKILIPTVCSTGHRVKYGVRSPKFIWAPCAQL
jgi:hypothetical protein